MDIRKLHISNINPAPYNPRVDLQPGDPEYEKLKRSIQEFGYVQLLIWNERSGNLVGGHQGFKILVYELGQTEVDVSVVDLDDAQEKALNIALNKISGAWDEERLALVLAELQESELDLTLSGFDNEEVSELLSEYIDIEVDDPVVEDDFDIQKALKEIKEPETKQGDIWQLGRHLLMCGDSTSLDDVQTLMDGTKADLVVTDPPYNVAFQSDSAELAAVVRRQCIWVKNASTFGFAQYQFKHEPVFYAHLKGQAPTCYGDRKQTTVWRSGLQTEVIEPETVWEVSRGDVNKYVHPTQKPLELLAIPISNSSQKDDTVADFFGGSGSTLMTCEQMGRTCRSMELDPKFCDVIKRRYYEATGIEPVLIRRLQEAA